MDITNKRNLSILLLITVMIILILSLGFFYITRPVDEWYLDRISTNEAHKLTQGSPNITVAVIDTGIIENLMDMKNIWINNDEIAGNGIDDDLNGFVDDVSGWDFENNDNNPETTNDHGTLVSKLILKVAPNIKIMPIKFISDDGSLIATNNAYSLFADAVNYAVNNGADIIHFSIYDLLIPEKIAYEALKNAYDNEVTIVGITGNEGGKVLYPAKYDEVIAVSATYRNDSITDFSGKGPENEICAPGDEIQVKMGSQRLTFWGTSVASPFVSGTIALMLSINNTLSNDLIRSILHESAIDLGISGKDNDYGYGLLSVYNSVSYVMENYSNINYNMTVLRKIF